MKQQDAYKLLAGLMILTMIIVPVAYVITSPPGGSTQQTNEQETQKNTYNPDYWGVNQPFYSISDALNMTPVGTMNANYVDLEGMTPQMSQWVRADLPIISEVDSLYKSNTTKIYYASLQEGKNNSFLLLSTMNPEKNDFEFIVLPSTYQNYYLLQRQDTGAINIMGTPVIYAPPTQTIREVLEIITSLNKTATGYDRYDGLLSKVDPAPFQTVNSNISFADQFYMGIRDANGSYERTTAYLNANSSTLKKLDQLKTNSTQRGFTQYDITRSGNYTVVKITGSDLISILSEETD